MRHDSGGRQLEVGVLPRDGGDAPLGVGDRVTLTLEVLNVFPAALGRQLLLVAVVPGGGEVPAEAGKAG